MMLIDGLLDGRVILLMLVEPFAYVDFSSIYCLVIPFLIQKLPNSIIHEEIVQSMKPLGRGHTTKSSISHYLARQINKIDK